MFTRRIIPCLDVKNGRVVKGIHFEGLRDAGDPVEVARRYERDGADELVFLDISATHEGRAILLDVVRRVAEQIFMPFTVGGGIRTLDDATKLIQAGAEKVSLNSAAVTNPEIVTEISQRFGRCATVVNIDPKRSVSLSPASGERGRGEGVRLDTPQELSKVQRPHSDLQIENSQRLPDTAPAVAAPLTPAPLPRKAGERETWWQVFINGGRTPTNKEALAWARELEQRGAGEIVLTSMDADGTRAGYDLPMLRAVASAVNIPVVASGGAGKPEHLYDAFAAGASAALAASIFHYDEYSIPVTKRYLSGRGVPIRLTT